MDAVPPIDRTSTTSFSIAYLNGSTDFIVNELLVEAAGVEPAPPQNANWLMARDFSSELSVNSLPCCQFVVLWSALQCSGVLPSLGDILETTASCWSMMRHRSC